MRLLLIAGLVGLAFTGSSLRAQEQMWPAFKTGEELLRDCSVDAPEARALCRGYIMAVHDVLSDIGALVDGIEACLSGRESVTSLVTLVVDYLEANPQVRSIKADGLVAYALALEYPCRPSAFQQFLEESTQ
jgi:hypothetical protein